MKIFNYFFTCMAMIVVPAFFMIIPNAVSGQKVVKKTGDPIPENLMKIFDRSCVGCHSTKGNSMAKSMLNFDKWQQMKPNKIIKKAGSVCSAVSSEFMPPKSVRKAKPELIPSKADAEAICKWAESLKPPSAPKKK
jgi:hypothetical protein